MNAKILQQNGTGLVTKLTKKRRYVMIAVMRRNRGRDNFAGLVQEKRSFG
jgi:hypothetical protein